MMKDYGFLFNFAASADFSSVELSSVVVSITVALSIEDGHVVISTLVGPGSLSCTRWIKPLGPGCRVFSEKLRLVTPESP